MFGQNNGGGGSFHADKKSRRRPAWMEPTDAETQVLYSYFYRPDESPHAIIHRPTRVHYVASYISKHKALQLIR